VVLNVNKIHLAGAALLLSLMTACGGSSSKPGPAAAPPPNLGATVTLKDIAFNPGTVTIRSAQSVWWRWEDGSVPHNVTADTFQSLTQEHGTYSHTFPAAGTYLYRCTIHSAMTGKVIVHP
jgi:plastocyanin